MPGCHNHLRKDTVSIFVIVKEHRDFGIVSWRPIEELSEFSLHGLHRVRTFDGLAGWLLVYSMKVGRTLVMSCGGVCCCALLCKFSIVQLPETGEVKRGNDGR